MGEGANRGMGLLELDEVSRNDGKPTLLPAIVNISFGFMLSPMLDIECRTGPSYGGLLHQYRAELGYTPGLSYCYSPVIKSFKLLYA